MENWNGNEYAAMNLRTLKENIAAYASYATNHAYSPICNRTEQAQRAVQRLINAIENDK